MALSLYDASVPVYLTMLRNLAALLDKAEAHAAANGVDPATYLQARLAPDMHPLTNQIQIASDAAKGGAARLAGVEPPSMPDTETTWAEVKARVAKTIAFVEGLKPEQFEGDDDRTIELWEAFKVRYGPHLAPHWIEAGDWVASRFVELSQPGESPRCLVHQDFRPDNMMFGTPEGGHPLTVLDWQSIAFGVGATDLGYFLAGALPREVRRAHEPELLQLYLDTLSGLGVRGYDMTQLRRDYARGGRSLFFTAFFAAMIVTQTKRGDHMFLQMLGSGADHMIDTGAIG